MDPIFITVEPKTVEIVLTSKDIAAVKAEGLLIVHNEDTPIEIPFGKDEPIFHSKKFVVHGITQSFAEFTIEIRLYVREAFFLLFWGVIDLFF